MRYFILIILIAIILITPIYALKETTIYLPAVEETDYGDEGILAILTVNIKQGNGHVYVDTWPLTKIDTQVSARTAKKVACDLLYMDCSHYDFFYTIRSDAQIVGGPSGGAAMTIATLASLLDLNITNNVFITGTINLDSSIGPVGGILEKAEAVSKKGKTFLIPYGESNVERKKVRRETIGYITIEKTTPEQINVVDYAKKHWNLTVKEVRTIREAFEYFTGYKIKELRLKFKKTKEYQRVMKKLADELISRATELKKSCIKKLNESTISYNYRDQILKICEDNLEKARDNYNNGNYYASASIAFSKLISYRYGEKLIEFLESDDEKFYLRDYLKNIEENIFGINTSNIELYAIIEERLSEVYEKLDEAWRNYYNENYLQGLHYGSFAEERLYTANLWMKYANEFPSYIENQSEFLKDIANRMISEASSIITYSSLTSSNSYLNSARNLLERARDNYKDGNYYAAIIYSLKSQANAELASEILFKDKDYLLELHRKNALVAINKTKSIIGQSYFEYAQTLEDDNQEASLIYYTYAKKLSKLSEILNKEIEKDMIIPTEYIERISCNYENYYNLTIFISIMIFFAGLLIGKKL